MCDDVFNVLGDALLNVFLQKSYCFQLSRVIDISQGSIATHLRCGRIFSTITNFLLILTVKKSLKTV